MKRFVAGLAFIVSALGGSGTADARPLSGQPHGCGWLQSGDYPDVFFAACKQDWKLGSRWVYVDHGRNAGCWKLQGEHWYETFWTCGEFGPPK